MPCIIHQKDTVYIVLYLKPSGVALLSHHHPSIYMRSYKISIERTWAVCFQVTCRTVVVSLESGGSAQIPKSESSENFLFERYGYSSRRGGSERPTASAEGGLPLVMLHTSKSETC